MKKSFLRAGPDRTQTTRQAVQLAFLALNIWIGIEFYRFVLYYETDGQAGLPQRPPGIEGWLPIASLMNLKAWMETGSLPSIHPAGVFLLIAFLSIAWLLRKTFCSWLCPVGTFSEYLGKLGRKLFRRNFKLTPWLDLPLRSIKYVLMAFFVFVVATMSANQILAFLGGPYGIVADVKLLNFFRTLTLGGVAVLTFLAVASMFVQNFWCRYLCPYGGLMGLLALASPLKIKRDAALCIDCGKCAKACPSSLKVDQLVTISSAECTGCLSCVASCPVDNTLYMSLAGRRKVPTWALAGGIAALFLGCVLIARSTGHWQTNLPQRLYMELVPRANEFEHP
ncbi:MAG TPA: 4Fe-4S binding protein [Bryobacteraceae bacterium]|nr:4Fe-4S binding protein [Bryobacteraceae bacterium]